MSLFASRAEKRGSEIKRITADIRESILTTLILSAVPRNEGCELLARILLEFHSLIESVSNLRIRTTGYVQKHGTE